MVSGAVNRYTRAMGEDRLRSLIRKGSLTSKLRRIIVILLVFSTILIIYHASSHPVGASLRASALQQLGITSDVHDEQARIGKISILYGGNVNRAYERALQTHKRHNRKHGYPMFIQRVDVLDGYWTKPAFIHYMILRELRKPESQRLQWFFWFDADTIVLNYNVAMEDFLPPENDETLKKIHVLAANDWNGLNNGIFAIRVTRHAAELFAGILAFREFEPDTPLWFQDQSAMEFMLKRRKFVNHFARVPQRWFNAYEPAEDKEPGPEHVHPGDFLIHFAGVGDRNNHMNKWSDLSEEMSPKWNAPIHKTWYPQEIERFWNRTKNVHEARLRHWDKATKRLTASITRVNETINSWKESAESTDENFLTLLSSFEKADQFSGNASKIDNDDVIKEDLHKMNTIVLDLEDAYRVFSDAYGKKKPKGAATTTAEEETAETAEVETAEETESIEEEE